MPEPTHLPCLPALFKWTAETHGALPAFATRQGRDGFQTVSYKELYDLSICLSTAVIDRGLQPREHVAILADNRLEWMITSCAIQLAGAVDVPRSADTTVGDIAHIIPHSDASILFVENEEILERARQATGVLDGVQYCVLMKRSAEAPEALNLYDLIDHGRQLREQGDRRVEERSAQVSSSDLFTLIYTSGTTGPPKGVMLTHANVISQLEKCPVRFTPEDRMLSILPIWHIAERVFEMVAMRNGCCTYYSNVRNFRQDLQTVKPTFIGSAPRLWESLFQTIRTTVGKSSAIRRSLFHTACFLAHQVRGSLRRLRRHEAELEPVSWSQRLLTSSWSAASLLLCGIPHLVLDRLVLYKLRESLGGQLKGSISGAGALPGYVDEFFNDLGIPVLEAYGMTETSPLISTRTFEQPVLGTVGPVYPDTELRLVDTETGETIHPARSGRGQKGEIHVRGPQVMQGYYKDPEVTNKVLRDGWLNTGDLGLLTFNDCLKLVGRSKDTIVLSNGENVEPVPIENKLLESKLIAQCMVVGQDQKYLTVLVVPDPDQLTECGGTYEGICRSEQAKSLILTDIKRLVSDEQGFKPFERVSECYLVPKPFEVGDELTNLLKLRRNIVASRYAAEIDALYVTM